MTEIRAGDILFICPNNLFFKLVRYWTRDKYGHVAIVVDVIGDHVLIVEAQPRGIDVNDLVWRIKNKEPIAIYRLRNLDEKKRKAIVEEALNFVGAGYDFEALLNFVAGGSKYGKKKKYYCSELIYRILLKVGLIKHTEPEEMVSPKALRLLIENIADKVLEINSGNYDR